MSTRLPLSQIKTLLKELPQWKFANEGNYKVDTIIRDYQFPNFEKTWAFLTRVAMKCHKLGHHPKIINEYNLVTIELSTHDVNGLSDLDFKMAKSLEKVASEVK